MIHDKPAPAPEYEGIADAMPGIIDGAYRLWLALDRAVPLEDVLALGVRLYRAESAEASRGGPRASAA